MITVTVKAKPNALSYSLLIRIALLIGVVAILIAGCIREPDNEYGGKGEFLAIGAHFPKVLNDIVYTAESLRSLSSVHTGQSSHSNQFDII